MFSVNENKTITFDGKEFYLPVLDENTSIDDLRKARASLVSARVEEEYKAYIDWPQYKMWHHKITMIDKLLESKE
jgi:hypothetical protein